MICKTSQCYEVIALSNPFTSFQLPLPVLLQDTELKVPLQLQLLLSATSSHLQIFISLSNVGSCSHLHGEVSLFSIITPLNFCFSNHPHLVAAYLCSAALPRTPALHWVSFPRLWFTCLVLFQTNMPWFWEITWFPCLKGLLLMV